MPVVGLAGTSLQFTLWMPLAPTDDAKCNDVHGHKKCSFASAFRDVHSPSVARSLPSSRVSQIGRSLPVVNLNLLERRIARSFCGRSQRRPRNGCEFPVRTQVREMSLSVTTEMPDFMLRQAIFLGFWSA